MAIVSCPAPLLLDEEHNKNCSRPTKDEEKPAEEIENKKNISKKPKEVDTVSNVFQMPLHYPRYTKKDYEDMPEWKLDLLLAQYGLVFTGEADLAGKREFAKGAFLWPDFPEEPQNSPKKNLAKMLTNFLRFW